MGQTLNRKCIPSIEIGISRSNEKTSPIGDPRDPENTPVNHDAGQSRGNETRLTELEAAIANMTRLLAKTDDAKIASELVTERRTMRLELEALRRDATG